MAVPDSTIPTETKVRAYGSLAETNQAWGTIVTHIAVLEQAGFLTPVQSKRFRLTAQEYQADMNYCITNAFCTRETEEAGHYGKRRRAMETRLNLSPSPSAEKQPKR